MARRGLKITTEQVATLLGSSSGSVSKVERDDNPNPQIRAAYIRLMRDDLNIDFDDDGFGCWARRHVPPPWDRLERVLEVQAQQAEAEDGGDNADEDDADEDDVDDQGT
jgi:transcriptional regulator with XRE-family HTH domain